MNGTLSSLSAKLELHFHDLLSNWSHREVHKVTLLPNQATELLSTIRCPGPPQDNLTPPSGDPIWTSTYSVVASARLVDSDGKVLARFADWPQPYRYLTAPDPGLAVKVEGEVITVSVERPVKALFFGVDGAVEEVKWSDNALDVVPGDPQTITGRGLSGRKLTVAYLGKEWASKI